MTPSEPLLVRDKESDGKLVAVTVLPRPISDVDMDTGETVAEANPEYPADDTATVAVYQSALEQHFGLSWLEWSREYLAMQVAGSDCNLYTFPRSRLRADDRAVRPEDTSDEQSGE